MTPLKDQWAALDPAKRRWAVVGGVGLAVVSALYLFSGGNAPVQKQASRQDMVRHVLTDQNPDDVGIDALSARMNMLSTENKQLSDRLNGALDELKRLQFRASQPPPDPRIPSNVTRSIDRLQGQVSRLEEANKNGAKVDVEAIRRQAADDYFANAPAPKVEPAEPYNGSARGSRNAREGTTAVATNQIRSFSEPEPKAPPASKQDKDKGVFIPAGSILTGAFLNGLEAPTSEGGRHDPFPATIRIQKDAILPNLYRADVRECFLIVSGFGDMSSERAYLRGETLSCVREDGKAIEVPLDAYVVGEDGKVGVRGTLVSRQGTVIARSLAAGFLSGAASAFNVNPVPVLNTSPTGQTQYQQVMSPGALQGAGIKGASNALDRLANFYIKMAEAMFPVIEIDPGRQVDIIVTHGTRLRIKG